MNTQELRSTVRSNKRLITRRNLSTPVSEANVPLNSNQSAQKLVLVWLDPTIDKTDADYHDLLIHVEEIGITYEIFTDTDKCARSLMEMTNEKVILVVSGFAGEHMMNFVHDMAHIDSIYIFCGDVRRHERWVKKWPKIKGLLTDIYSICDIIKQNPRLKQKSATVRPVASSDEHDLFLGFLAPDDDVQSKELDELDPSFMFTTILKEILLELEYDEISMEKLVTFCRKRYHEDKEEMAIIDDFETNYHSQTPVWWYTRECFAYHMLNYALRTLDANTIIKMGFFLRDLHLEIVKLYKEQLADKEYRHSFVVYRGQALTIKDLNMLMKSVGGLVSFNNFLSTSMNKDVALQFTFGGAKMPDRVGILFIMHINASHSSTVFADVLGISYFPKESEILFSMHTVFRIKSIKQTDENVYQVNLILTDDSDQQLQDLANRLRKETVGSSGWDRIGKLLIRLGNFDAAQETYKELLERSTNYVEQAHFCHQLGYIKEDLGEYDNALSFYEKSLEIKQKDPSSDNSHLAMYYNNSGTIYDKKGDYTTAAAFFLKAINIFQKILPPKDLRLAICYNNIGSTYHSLCEYSKALSYYDKALAIDLECLPTNDPSLGSDYNNIGLVYHDIHEYDIALSYFEKAFAIYNKALQPDHPSFSSVYNSFGSVYNSMEQYSKALLYYEKALEIDQKTLHSNHPYLGVSYNNMGSVYKNMQEYSKALSMFERALDIETSAQSSNETRIQLYKKNIDLAKDKLP